MDDVLKDTISIIIGIIIINILWSSFTDRHIIVY